jgi:CBS domain-containing protein
VKIQDIMTKNPSCVTPSATVREAAQIMDREDVGIVPVVENEGERRLVGVITDRDIAIRCVAANRDGNCRVADVMSSDNLMTCGVEDHVNRAMDAMRSEKVRRIPVVDERGGLVGIVSQADIVRKARDDARAEETIEQISEPGGPSSQ